MFLSFANFEMKVAIRRAQSTQSSVIRHVECEPSVSSSHPPIGSTSAFTTYTDCYHSFIPKIIISPCLAAFEREGRHHRRQDSLMRQHHPQPVFHIHARITWTRTSEE